MSEHRLFGPRPAGAVTIVEPSVMRPYLRRARMTFYSVTAAGAVLGAVVASPWLHPIVGAVLGALAGAVLGIAVGSLMVAWPVLRTVWHWAAEIALVLVLVAGWTALGSATYPWVPALTLLALTAPLALGRVRRVAGAWVWCAIVRHRLRLCFAEFIKSANRVAPNRLPLILLARPTPAGERVWLWLRPGLALSDLDERMPKLAVACWASEVRVVRSPRFAALVRVDVTRRDPLTATVGSPLARLIPTQRRAAAIDPGDAEIDGLDLPDIPDDGPAPPRRPRAA